MKVKYRYNLGEKELNVISIKPVFTSGLAFHVLTCSDGTEYDATYFNYSSGCTFIATLPDNW